MTLTAPPPPQPETLRRRLRRERWRLPVFPLVIALVCLVGVTILTYPYIAAWFTQYQQSRLIEEYSHEVRDLDADARTTAIQSAEDYNSTLTGGASVAADERLPLAEEATGGDGADYASLLAADDNGLMARIKIPSIDLDLPIYHGTSDDVLRKGIGHLEGTALPVGGEGTHSVLTGHRGLATAELFTNLDKVAVGDTFTIEVFGEVLTYRVRETLIVEPDQTQTLYAQVGEDLITLVTCTPLGINSHRILVTAERITPTPIADLDKAGATPNIPGFPWWALIVGGTGIVAAVYVWYSGRPASPRSAESATRRRLGGSSPSS